MPLSIRGRWHRRRAARARSRHQPCGDRARCVNSARRSRIWRRGASHQDATQAAPRRIRLDPENTRDELLAEVRRLRLRLADLERAFGETPSTAESAPLE